jgi:hypothetical protein
MVGSTVTGSAPAFYFKGWPGDGLKTPPSLIQPTAPSWSNPPSGRTDTDQHTPPNTPHESTDQPKPPTPQETPEPGTLVLAAMGLAGMGLRRFRIG